MAFEIKLTINALIEDGLITLQELNNRISLFNYGFVDKKNRPSPIQPSALRNPQGPSGQKAAQVKCLAFYLPLIVADLVEETSDYWELFLLLLDLYKIVIAPSISAQGTYFLKALIHDHHQLFLQLY